MGHLKVVHNMRATSAPWFVEYLLRAGGGSEEATIDNEIRLPHDICVPLLAVINNQIQPPTKVQKEEKLTILNTCIYY